MSDANTLACHYYRSIVFHFDFIIYFYAFGKILKFVWGLGTIQMLMHVDGERKFNRYLNNVRDSSSHRTRKKNKWYLLVCYYRISILVLPPDGLLGSFFGMSI